MQAKIIKRNGNKITVQVEVDISGDSMLEKEEIIQKAVNDVGCLYSSEALKSFDTNGDKIQVDGIKYTSKGLQKEKYETIYGQIEVERYVYQNSNGGKTFCPMENDAVVILNSTPRYAKIMTFKYASLSSREVTKDIEETNGRVCDYTYCKKIADYVGEIANFADGKWEYELPDDIGNVKFVSIGIDGTCMLMVEKGWREAMAGTISFFNGKNERVHTIYIGTPPEYGKKTFLTRFMSELDKVKTKYPDIPYYGVADGAHENWTFLDPIVSTSIIDFYHASEYVKLAAKSILPNKKDKIKREKWIEDELHKLKNNIGGAKQFLNLITKEKDNVKKKHQENMQTVITYFTNHHKRMPYANQVKKGLPIGSGITEAACKELIKERLCKSGMRWKNDGAEIVINLRSLKKSDKRWGIFWNHIIDKGHAGTKKITM